MYIIRWTSVHCMNAKLLMKIDDNALLRMERIDDLKSLIFELLKQRHPIYAGKIRIQLLLLLYLSKNKLLF